MGFGEYTHFIFGDGGFIFMETKFQTLITGLQHIGIPTNDMKKTVAFYQTLGFQVALQTVNEAADERVTFLRMGYIVLEVYENKKAAMASGALDHIAFNVTDIEAVFQLAKEQGFPMLDAEIQFLPFWEQGVRFFTVKGPNEEKVEFSQYL